MNDYFNEIMRAMGKFDDRLPAAEEPVDIEQYGHGAIQNMRPSNNVEDRRSEVPVGKDEFGLLDELKLRMQNLFGGEPTLDQLITRVIEESKRDTNTRTPLRKDDSFRDAMTNTEWAGYADQLSNTYKQRTPTPSTNTENTATPNDMLRTHKY